MGELLTAFSFLVRNNWDLRPKGGVTSVALTSGSAGLCPEGAIASAQGFNPGNHPF